MITTNEIYLVLDYWGYMESIDEDFEEFRTGRSGKVWSWVGGSMI